MALTTSPFHPVTGELLPSHRDAYLRGDLSACNTDLVDAYLKANPAKGDAAFQRFHAMKESGHAVRPVGWLQHQFYLVRTEPVRFRRRAGTAVLVGLLLSGAVFAGANLPVGAGEAGALPGNAPVAEELAAATTTVRGQIMDERGRPLIGATVLDKTTGRGVSTDGQGYYALTVPANRTAHLQYGYGGYDETELDVRGRATRDVTLEPRTRAKKHRWLFF